MAWDTTGRYYYRHVRIDGKPRRVYVGAGPAAALASQMDAQEQAQRAAQDAQRRLERHQDRATWKELDAQYQNLRSFVAALLQANGYYQHRREWRKMGKKVAQLTGPDSGPAVDLRELVKRVSGPKPSRADLQALHAALDDQDDTGALICALAAASIQIQIIEKASESEASRAVMIADVRRIGRTLGRDTSPAFERPLIEHIVTCWLRLQLVEMDMSRSLAGSHSRESGVYWDRRLTEAQRRYLRAMHLLAKLRNMGPLQVNIANQQVVMNNNRGTE